MPVKPLIFPSRAFLERGTHEYARCLVVWYRRSWISDVEVNDLVLEMYYLNSVEL